jgi:tetratricopeptide (TPR) repeat protein
MRDVGYDIYVRAGLLEYLHDQPGAALVLFEKAKPLGRPLDVVVVYGHIPTGIERLIDVAKTGKSITPEVVCQGHQTAKVALMLADIYHQGQQWEKSLDLCNRFLNSRAAARATPEQRSYALFKRGRNYYCLDGKSRDPDAAMLDYIAAAQTAPKAPWASRAMFMAANVQWNDKQNAEMAVSIWNRLIHEYPKSEDADGAALFVGLAYQASGRPAEAKVALNDFLRRRPDSHLAKSARMHLQELDAELGGGQGKRRQ